MAEAQPGVREWCQGPMPHCCSIMTSFQSWHERDRSRLVGEGPAARACRQLQKGTHCNGLGVLRGTSVLEHIRAASSSFQCV